MIICRTYDTDDGIILDANKYSALAVDNTIGFTSRICEEDWKRSIFTGKLSPTFPQILNENAM